MMNLVGPDLIIIALIVLMLGAPVAIVVFFLRFASPRRKEPAPSYSPGPPPLPPAASVADRLQQLDDLKQQNLVSESEYADKRRAILQDL